jgi:hypothetical protein
MRRSPEKNKLRRSNNSREQAKRKIAHGQL